MFHGFTPLWRLLIMINNNNSNNDNDDNKVNNKTLKITDNNSEHTGWNGRRELRERGNTLAFTPPPWFHSNWIKVPPVPSPRSSSATQGRAIRARMEMGDRANQLFFSLTRIPSHRSGLCYVCRVVGWWWSESAHPHFWSTGRRGKGGEKKKIVIFFISFSTVIFSRVRSAGVWLCSNLSLAFTIKKQPPIWLRYVWSQNTST